MEIGYAGYGLVSMDTWPKDKTEVIRFDFYNEDKGRSTKGNIIYLGLPEQVINEINKHENYFTKNILLNDFQMRHWMAFRFNPESNGMELEHI
jgi:hypothetical protein